MAKITLDKLKKQPREIRQQTYYTVSKSNDLIQKSRFDLTLQQQKIVLFLISKIKPNDEDFKLYEFSIKEFAQACLMDETSGENYSKIKKAIKAIADQSIWVTLENGTETLVRWIEKPYIDKNSGTIKIKLDNDMKPFLLQLKKNFTSYELLPALRLNSKYSLRLFEYINSIHYDKKKIYKKVLSVDELKRVMGAEHYKQYSDFRKRALQPAIEEIKGWITAEIEIKEIKKGRAIEKIEITLTPDEIIYQRTKADNNE